MLPRHPINVPEDKKAVAPYNFVELPNDIVEVKQESLPQENSYDFPLEKRYTGKIECKLTTKAPLYIRCGLTTKEFADEKESKNLPDFFYTEPEFKNLKPVIPGSSLRGMLRTLIEIITFSKISKVTNRKPFYRSLGDKALKEIYAFNFVEESQLPHPDNSKIELPCYRSKIHTGFIKVRNNKYIIEECNYGRIDRSLCNTLIPTVVNHTSTISKPLYQGSGSERKPSWDYQHKTIYVEIDSQEKNYFFKRQLNKNQKERHPDLYLRFRKVHRASFKKTVGFSSGKLVITGDMQYKHLEFVFLDDKLKEYSVDEGIIRRFHDDDQITKWQEDAFPKGIPNQSREKAGYLRDGEPVFFLLNEHGETILFLGRAQMFRLPYDLSPYDLIPENLRDKDRTDISEAIFGYVDGKNRHTSRAGRVFLSDAICTQTQDIWYQGDFDKTLTPKILGSPKVTTFQHYLVQTSTRREELKHYSPQSDGNKTPIRGHKLYWHKPSIAEIEETNTENIKKSKSQYTEIKPIKAGVSFKFNINFENLSDIELGAVMWILQIAAKPEYCLSLGMGKPLGLGAIKIEHNLLLNNRQDRYSQLFSNNTWLTGEENQSSTGSTSEACIHAFEKFITDNIHPDDHPDGYNAIKLDEIPRIQMLLLMLRCDNPPSANNTRYMTIDKKEYVNRPVLPTPFQVMGKKEEDKRRFQSTSVDTVKKTDILGKSLQIFKVDQILDAMILKIKGVEVTYQLLDGMKKTSKEHKQAQFLQSGQNVKVIITALKDDGDIKNIRYYKPES